MLRHTGAALTVFQNAYAPRVLGKMTPDRLELTMIILKERKKRVRYLGSFFHHFGDRTLMNFAHSGARRGTRYIIGTHHDRIEYRHPSRDNSKVDLRAVKMAGTQYDMMGGYTRMSWDNSICSTNIMNDPTFKRQFSNASREETTAMLEEWGVRYIMLDEIRKPSLMDCKYHKHNIYSDKFTWSPDPDTNHMRGEIEYKWKGDELIEYGDYNAHTAHPANFSSSSAATAGAKAGAPANPWFRHTVTAPAPASKAAAKAASPS
ncbi:hypothetical protein NESM_000422500 [Novymonas esmeraldas]|uniref:Uncharacterized protein n=1 Tax=Novymonas esmeraldas TaxID=1808958 RepID=A0AAW0ELE6_9TRYP